MEPTRSIFDLAREMKNGPWIEACCEANRQKLRNRGVKESNRKDAHFKITQIRKFATAADAEGWVTDVTKALVELEGGMELEHLEHVLASLDPTLNAQLPPQFYREAEDTFNEALTTSAEKERQARFATEWQAFC